MTSRSSRLLNWILVTVAIGLPADAIAAQTLASAEVDVELRLSPIAGATQTLAGGRFWLSIRPQFRFGGAAWALPRATREGSLDQSGFELDFGYGGIGVEWLPIASNQVALRLLLGAGSGTVFDRATGARVDAESFFVLEPELATELPLNDWIAATAGLGWRSTLGVDAITRVESGGLSSWTLSLGMRLGPF